MVGQSSVWVEKRENVQHLQVLALFLFWLFLFSVYARPDASIAACTLCGLALVGCLRYAALYVKTLENKIRRTP